MKKYFVSIVCLCAGIALMSCSKDDDDVTSSVTSVNAIVENGSSYNSKVDKVKAIMEEEYGDGYLDSDVASGQYKDGGFTISLPETISSKYLETWSSEGGLTVSDPNVEIGSIEDFVAYKSGVEVGGFVYSSYSPTSKPSTGIDATYFYATGDVKITGSQSTTISSYTFSYNFNITLKKGWNIVYAAWTVSNTSETVSITNSAPSGMKWYFEEPESKSAVMVKSAMATGSKHKSLFKPLN